MNESRKHQVSLRGASAREITRDALLERVNQERELRNYTRRANVAVLLIQRVWRRHRVVKAAALQLRQEWEAMMSGRAGALTGAQISGEILRPCLFFINYLSVRCEKIGARDRDCMMSCFRIVLEDMTTNNIGQNFCLMAIGDLDERNIWLLQSKKLISVCLFIISMFDYSNGSAEDIALTSTAMRLSVLLTDPKGWNCVSDAGRKVANTAVKDLLQFMGRKNSGLCNCIRKFMLKLEAPFSSQGVLPRQMEDIFLILASAITLSLRPFHLTNIDINGKGMMECAVEQYCIYILTIPRLPHRLPPMLVPALRHKSVLSPCLRMLLVMTGFKREDLERNDRDRSIGYNLRWVGSC